MQVDRHPLFRWSTAALLLASALGCQKTEPSAPPIPPTEILAVDTPPPAYPPELACNDVGGQVVLLMTIDIDGLPKDVRMTQSSGVPALDAAAQEGVRHWRFKPATRSGRPIAQKMKSPVTFTPPKPRPQECFLQDEKS